MADRGDYLSWVSKSARETPKFAPLVRRVWSTIRKRELFSNGDGVLVAVSGGADSLALLDALSQLSRPLDLALAVAYVDHGLRRGTHRDAAVVERCARDRGIPFERLVVKVPRRASLEEAAREARLAALLKCAKRLRLHKVAIAHTASDQAETVLMWLLRGTGVRGLAGMRAARPPFVRPLIDLTRVEVRAYALAAKLPVRDDPMNAELRFTRNRIRHELLPLLESSYNRQVVRHLASLADDFAALNDFLDAAIAPARPPHASSLDVRAVRLLPLPLRQRAIEAAMQATWPGVRLSRTHFDAVLRLAASANGRSRLSIGPLVVVRDGDQLAFRRAPKAASRQGFSGDRGPRRLMFG